MDPLIITVAGIGAELTRAQQPNLPLTADEIASDARACEEAGASIYHLHVRDEAGLPTMDVEIYRTVHDAIRDATDLIVQFSTGGAVTDGEAERIAPLGLQPEMATLTPGSVNFGDAVFSNPLPLVRRFFERMTEKGVLPEFEIFDVGMLRTAERLVTDYGSDHHLHYDFVLNVPGGLPAWPDSIGFLRAHLPKDATWSATGIGSAHVAVASEAIEAGGHVRTGFEDVLWFERDVRATSNAQLIRRVAEMAGRAGRRVASPEQARQILELKR